MRTSFWSSLLDLIEPRSCPICGSRLAPDETALCAVCHLHLPITHLEASPTDNVLARLFWGLIPIKRATSLFYYEPHAEAAQLIYNIKYGGMPHVAEAMGRLTARQMEAADFFEGIDALVPVPLTKKRQWQRGYNQSEMIARGIREVTRLPIYNNVVKRIHFSKSQTEKNAWERRENVDGVFKLARPDCIGGKHLLIVDDIVTTGATINACAQELCKAGGVTISVLTLGFTKR